MLVYTLPFGMLFGAGFSLMLSAEYVLGAALVLAALVVALAGVARMRQGAR